MTKQMNDIEDNKMPYPCELIDLELKNIDNEIKSNKRKRLNKMKNHKIQTIKKCDGNNNLILNQEKEVIKIKLQLLF